MESRNRLATFVVVAFAGIATAATACSSSDTTSTPTTTPDSGAAAATATFTSVYTTIIATKCATCHTTAAGDGVTEGKLDMTTQANAYTNLVNAPAAGVACASKGGTRVVPNKPDDSVMYLKVSPDADDPSPCGSKMPLGEPALSKAEADLIESWINAGALNN